MCADANTSSVQKISITTRGGTQEKTVSSGGQDTSKSFRCHDFFPEAMEGGNHLFEEG